MRRTFATELHKNMKTNSNIIVIVADLGYGMFDQIKNDFPDRFYNVGAAEQSMLDMAVGMALNGKIPVCYSITPFLLYRGFETIRNYINHESIPVKLVGSGRGKDYSHDGISHWALEDKEIMKNFKNIMISYPSRKENIAETLYLLLKYEAPVYLNLER
jgi:transketolase